MTTSNLKFDEYLQIKKPSFLGIQYSSVNEWLQIRHNNNWDNLIPSLLQQQRVNSLAPTTTSIPNMSSSPQQQSFHSISPYALYHPTSLLNGLNINAVALAAVQQMVNARSAAIGLGSLPTVNNLNGQDIMAAAMRKNVLFATGTKDLMVNMPSHGGLMVLPPKYTPL